MQQFSKLAAHVWGAQTGPIEPKASSPSDWGARPLLLPCLEAKGLRLKKLLGVNEHSPGNQWPLLPTRFLPGDEGTRAQEEEAKGEAGSYRLTWGSGTSLPLRKAELCMSAYPFTRPSWLPPPHTLSLALNLLYNFKIKFKKKNRKEKALKAKYLPRYLSQEEKKVSAYVKRWMQGMVGKSEQQITRKMRETHLIKDT